MKLVMLINFFILSMGLYAVDSTDTATKRTLEYARGHQEFKNLFLKNMKMNLYAS